MKKFCRTIVKTGLMTFLAILILLSFDFFVVQRIVGCQYSEQYSASILDKAERLGMLESPKIILIGDSNVAFGINSPMIEEAMGMPVVNLAVGGVGSSFYEELSKPEIESGDIVIVSYAGLGIDSIMPSAAWQFIENHWELWHAIRVHDYPAMIREYPLYCARATYRWMTGIKNSWDTIMPMRNSFNEYGDVIIRSEESKMSVEDLKQYVISVPAFSEKSVARLNEYNAFVRSQGATMLYAAYPILQNETTPTAKEFTEFEETLKNALDCEIISHYSDYFFSCELFYNSPTHLSQEGADVRTEKLIRDLSAWIERCK